MANRKRPVFEDREEAARELVRALKSYDLDDPLVLGIPRGGVLTGAILADELDAELDVVLSRKLRAPHQPEYAIGAVSESGQVDLNEEAIRLTGATRDYIQREKEEQLDEIARRKELIRQIRPPATIAGRTVIVTDDGIATGATMLAALSTVRLQHPKELIAAVPVSPPGNLDSLQEHADQVVCLLAPEDFWAVGQFYNDFHSVEDEEVLELLREAVERKSLRS